MERLKYPSLAPEITWKCSSRHRYYIGYNVKNKWSTGAENCLIWVKKLDIK